MSVARAGRFATRSRDAAMCTTHVLMVPTAPQHQVQHQQNDGYAGNKLAHEMIQSCEGKFLNHCAHDHESQGHFDRSERIHVVFQALRLPRPDESGHYQRLGMSSLLILFQAAS